MSDSAHDRLAAEARTVLSAAGIAPDDAAAVEAVVGRLVAEYQDRAHRGMEDYAFTHEAAAIRELVGEITGHGALEALLLQDGLEDVSIEGADVRSIGGGLVRPLGIPTTEAANRHTIDRLLAGTGHALNAATPTCDGVQVDLGGGRQGRLAAAIKPASPHLSAQIRVFGSLHGDLADMVADGTLSAAAANLLTLVVWAKGSILIGGQTGSRKSTLLVALLKRARSWHLVRLLEESYELALKIQFGGRYQCTRSPGSQTISELIQLMLRFRVDIIVVGEIRGKECLDLAQAASAVDGWLATIHSRSAEGSLDRLIQLSMLGGANVSREFVRDTFAENLDVVVHCSRNDDRDNYLARVTQISTVEPSLTAMGFTSTPLFTRAALEDELEWTNFMPKGDLADRLEALLPAGVTLRDVLTSTELL